MNEETGSGFGGFVATFIVGAVVGAGLALLYAPRTGREMRSLLRERSREMKDKTEDALQEARDAIRDRKAEVAAAVEGAKQAVNEERAIHLRSA